jgi:hypothetical protein
MDLNTVFLSLFGLMFLYAGYVAWTSPIPVTFNPIRNGLLVAQETGKTKQIVSKTGDASMQVELNRRRVIQTNGKLTNKFNANLGSLSGAIETYLITGICKYQTFLEDIIFDGGEVNDELCQIPGDTIYDAGGADTRVCGL